MPDKQDDFSAVLAPYRDLLLSLPKNENTLGYLTDIASVITDSFVSSGFTPPILVGGLAVD